MTETTAARCKNRTRDFMIVGTGRLDLLIKGLKDDLVSRGDGET